MKTNMTMLATLLCLLLIAFIPSGEARLLERDVLIGLGNPSAFDAGLNTAVTDAGSAALTDPAKKTELPCDQGEMKPWSTSAQNATDDKNMLTFRFKENRTGADAKKESPKADEAVYNVLPKGPTAPSGPSPRGNSNINGQGLSASHHSPGVDHMQVYDIAKSQQGGGGGHMRQEKDGSKKRILGSTPSPGGGH